jgi:hypothetical protein
MVSGSIAFASQLKSGLRCGMQAYPAGMQTPLVDTALHGTSPNSGLLHPLSPWLIAALMNVQRNYPFTSCWQLCVAKLFTVPNTSMESKECVLSP